MSIDDQKRAAAEAAVLEVKSGMRLGLGTGSTASFALRAIARELSKGALLDVAGVPTSKQTEALAKELGVPVLALDAVPALDLAIDGADEVDPKGDLIKGGGGALRREKEVELRAKRLVIIVDEAKLSPKLGTLFALPVEVASSAWGDEARFLAALGCTPVLRGGEATPFVTDGGNYIIDCRFAHGIDDPYGLEPTLSARPGVRAHGLFLRMASAVIVAGKDGVRRMDFNR